MKIFPLGVGGAFTKSNYHNNYIIEFDEKCLLIDAGTTLRTSLPAAGYDYLAIDYVFISHLHYDHVGGLEELVMTRFWQFEDGQHSPLKTTVIVHEKLLPLLKNYLKNSLENQGRGVDDFCDFIPLKDGKEFKIGDYGFSVIDTTNLHADGLISAGFKLSSEKANIVFSGDVKNLQLTNLKEQVDENTVAIFQDISFTFNGVHATLQEVLEYYPVSLHKKIYAMHYNDNVEDYKEAIKQANIRLVKRQEVLELF
ncbi:MBL fold metallo-hydrolase [Ureibacillus aquaedulcis]|uniref:MBL fold metallo-hydrolase n=1 Tax=Ureibacillus aquaedulcis TaxID=3058421 RepID=A0ABT8GVI5_9BACL|nr:MBL fold metallo-hydrolase [Ureibacillus sp. BA0131]MDN4495426.1 MBL fold metallo-hydrolase [Ureibacillus sp. BA0131]